MEPSWPGLAPLFGGKAAETPGRSKPTFQQVLKAWNPVTQKLAWSSKVMPFWSGGVMTTGSGLVVQGGGQRLSNRL